MNFPSIHDRVGQYFLDPDVEGDTVIYQQPELIRYRIRAVDREGKRVNVRKVLVGGMKPAEELWNKGMKVLAGAMFTINQGGVPVQGPDSVHQFEAGVLIGTLLERFRMNRGVTFTVETTKVTADEFDAAFEKVKKQGGS